MLLNPNESAEEKMDIAPELINLHPNTLEYLKKTERALINSIPIMNIMVLLKSLKVIEFTILFYEVKQKEAFFDIQMKTLR